MAAVDTLSPVCVDVGRDAPATLPVAAPLSGVSATLTPAAAPRNGAVPTSLHHEERWTFGLIAIFAAMLVAVAMQPASAQRPARRDDGRYAAMDSGASPIASARVALVAGVR